MLPSGPLMCVCSLVMILIFTGQIQSQRLWDRHVIDQCELDTDNSSCLYHGFSSPGIQWMRSHGNLPLDGIVQAPINPTEYFMRVEVNPNQTGSTSLRLRTSTGKTCLHFRYRMFGLVGRLEVRLLAVSVPTDDIVFTRKGNQGYGSHYGEAEVDGDVYDEAAFIYSTESQSHAGEVGLDDVILTSGVCDVHDQCSPGSSRNYRGMTSLTVGGLPCQPWNAQTPHTHNDDSPVKLQENRVVDAGSSCRQTDTGSRPRCYTTSRDVRDEACSVPQCPESMEDKVRLVSLVGEGVIDGAAISRVEVLHQGAWGTVCTLGWDNRDANVLCKQLGYPSGGLSLSWQSEWPRPTDGKIWLSGLNCLGNETSIWACAHSDWGITYGCSSAHYDDAFVRCFVTSGAGSCGDHQVRLVIDPLSGEELCLCRDGYHISNSKYSCTPICSTLYPGHAPDPLDPLICRRDGVEKALRPTFLNDSQVEYVDPEEVITDANVTCGVINISPQPSDVYNLAEGKPAYQSGVVQRSFAYWAVDGAVGSHLAECATPRGGNSWWVVDLGDVYQVETVEIFTPRSHWCGANNMVSSRPLTLLLGNEYNVIDNSFRSEDFRNCTDAAHLSCGHTSLLTCRGSARYVMVAVTTDPAVGFTALCEVRVYSNGVPTLAGNTSERRDDDMAAGRLLALVFSRDRRDTIFTCRRWILTAPPTKTFSVYITKFQISEKLSLFICQRNVVVKEKLITHSSSESGSLERPESLTIVLRRLCHSVSGVWVTGTSQQMTIQLTNNKVHDLVIFEALYKLTEVDTASESSGCQSPRRLPLGGGRIVSRPFPDDVIRDTCVWIVSANQGRFLDFSVSLEVFPFTYTEDCTEWMLAFHNGSRWSGRPFQTLCRGGLESVRSPGATVTIVLLVTRPSSRRANFTITYRETECMGFGEGSVTSSVGLPPEDYVCDGRCGRIRPPYIDGSQGLYVQGVSRTYSITAPLFHYIRLKFSYINLLYPPGRHTGAGGAPKECSAKADRILVYTSQSPDAEVFTYCGTYTSDTLRRIEHNSDRNMMRMRFLSGPTHAQILSTPSTGTLLGFEATWEVIPVNFGVKSAPSTDFDCPAGWALNQNYCYHLFSGVSLGLTWYEAENRCQGHGGHLVSIRDAEEMAYVHSLILTDGWNKSSTYIGLKKLRRAFRWSDGSVVSYTDWARGQPDGGTLERCTHVTNLKYFSTNYWYDVPCATLETHQFVCEMAAKAVGSGSLAVTRPSVEDLAVRSIAELSTADGVVLFVCHNDELILGAFRSDGVADCGDFSDESHQSGWPGCQEVGQFRCRSGDQCIDWSLVCDLVTHCPDGSDEEDCYLPACRADEFRCADGRCIRVSSRCDLLRNCAGEEDERNCEGAANGTYLCMSGERLAAELVCDGYTDCSTGEDELHCPRFEARCLHNELRCGNGVCVPDFHRCHLEYSRQGHPLGCRDVTHLRDCADTECAVGFYKCPNSYCLSVTSRCDGRPDCPGGEDEKHCFSNVADNSTAVFSCPGSFKCRLAPRCVPVRWRCDGVLDCPHGDDELLCGMFCPLGCTCEGATVDCRSLDLSSIPNLSSETRVLYLDNNSLEEHMLYALAEAPRIRILSLARNLVTSLKPGHFPPLLNLRELDLSYNTMESLRPQFLGGLPHLQTLRLPRNRLVTIRDGAFCGSPSIQLLDISGQKIRDVHPDAFRCLDTSLEKIVSSDYLFCCLTGRLADGQCVPRADGVSSCHFLLGSPFYRYSLWTLGTLAIFGNILVFGFKVKLRDMRSPYSLLLLNLLLADFLMGVYLYIIGSADVHYGQNYVFFADKWRHGGACALAGFLFTVSCEAALLLLGAMVLERLRAETVTSADRSPDRKIAVFGIAMIWIISVLLGILPLLPIEYFGREFYSSTGLCVGVHHAGLTSSGGWQYSIAIFVAVNLAVCILVAIGFVILLYEMRQRNKAGKVRRSVDVVSMTTSVHSTILVATDLLCWIPACLAALVVGTQVELSWAVMPWVVVLLLPLRAALGPVVSVLTSPWFIRPYRKRLYNNLTAAHATEFRDLQQEVCSMKAFVERSLDDGRDCGCVATLDVAISRWRLTIRDRLDVAILVAKTMEEYRITGRPVTSLDPCTIFLSQKDSEDIIGNHCVLARSDSGYPSHTVPSCSSIILEYARLIELLLTDTDL